MALVVCLAAPATAAPVCTGPWYRANLTTYESYPEPGSEECVDYNGCTWAGQFYGLEDRQTPDWVARHNIAAVHEKHWGALGMKVLKLRQGNREILVQVLDTCADADCDGCCSANLGGDGYLVDLEKSTMRRFGSDHGLVAFQLCD